MQYVRQAGSDPSFLIEALNKASGELRRRFFGIPRDLLLEPGQGMDDTWSLLGVAVHMRDVEAGFLKQLEAIVTTRNAEIPNVDLDDIPIPADYASEDDDEVLDQVSTTTAATPTTSSGT